MQDGPLKAAQVVLHQLEAVVLVHVGANVQVGQQGLEPHLVMLKGALEGRLG